MKCIPVFIVIIGLLAIISAQRTRNSNRGMKGFNFSDLIPSGQKTNRNNYGTRRRDFTEETSPELAQFSDLIPARQIEGDIEDLPRPPSNNNVKDTPEEEDTPKVFQEVFGDYGDITVDSVDYEEEEEENEVANKEEAMPMKDEDDRGYRHGYYGGRDHSRYPNKYVSGYSKPRRLNKYGFPSSAASNFVDNFRENADWEELRPPGKLLRRSKRSHLSHLRHAGHRGHVLPLPHDLPPSVAHDSLHREAVLAAMLQQRLLQQEHRSPHGLDNHHFVEVASPAHHVSHGTATAGHHTAVHQNVHQIHDNHHVPAQHHSLAHTVTPHHSVPIQHHVPVFHHDPHSGHHATSAVLKHMKTIHPPALKGYDPPVKGLTLEGVFGLSTRYHPAPEPQYHAPHVPDTKYHPPLKASYHAPKPKVYNPTYNTFKGDNYDYKKEYMGHPFSMEMIFGLPMHKHYMRKYGHMMHPDHHHGHHDHHAHHAPVHAPIHHQPKHLYVTPKPEPYHEPKPAYHKQVLPEYHPTPGPKYHPAPTPKYHPKPEPKYVEPHQAILRPEILYHEPKVIIPHFQAHPTPVYHEPKALSLHPEPSYHEPAKPVIHHPHHLEPVYHEPAKPVIHHSSGYAAPHDGGSLEDIFHIKSKYALHKKPAKLYATPKPEYAVAPHTPGYSPVSPSSYAAGYNYVYPQDVSHGYTLHYLPYEDYVPVHAETKAALKKNLPHHPGSAHILVPSPTPHPHSFLRESILPHHSLHPHGGRRQKRSANQG